VDVAGKNRKIFVFIHENTLVAALVQVPNAFMPPIVIAGIGDVELAHEFGKIAFGGLDEQMKMVGHKDVTVEFDCVDINGLDENLQKPSSIIVVLKDVLTFVAPACNVIHCSGILDAKSARHSKP
jgi:hypothetical protein